MVSAVLFELEGVIADMRVARRAGIQRTLGDDGIVLSESEYERCCRGVPLRVAIRTALDARHADADDTAVDLRAHMAEQACVELLGKGVSLQPGAHDLVHSLQGRTRLGIVSRASRREVDLVLSLASLQDAFECVICDEDAFPSKPAPAPYLAAVERLAKRRPLRADAVVALEDGPPGIRSARAAGIACIAVGAMPAHMAMEAHAFVESLAGQTLDALEALVAPGGGLPR